MQHRFRAVWREGQGGQVRSPRSPAPSILARRRYRAVAQRMPRTGVRARAHYSLGAVVSPRTTIHHPIIPIHSHQPFRGARPHDDGGFSGAYNATCCARPSGSGSATPTSASRTLTRFAGRMGALAPFSATSRLVGSVAVLAHPTYAYAELLATSRARRLRSYTKDGGGRRYLPWLPEFVSMLRSGRWSAGCSDEIEEREGERP